MVESPEDQKLQFITNCYALLEAIIMVLVIILVLVLFYARIVSDAIIQALKKFASFLVIVNGNYNLKYINFNCKISILVLR